MPSTYTDSLRLEEQGVGENNNTWGNKLNATIDLIDKSIAGHIAVNTTGGAAQLTTVNNGEDQARYKIIEITGSLASNAIVEVPAASKEYIVWDSTTRNGFTLSFRIGAAGSTVLIPASTTRAFGISTDGTDWRPLSADLATETAPGILQLATTAQAQAGTDDTTAITPSTLQDVTATETRKGVIELATSAEAQTGTDSERGVTPAVLQAMSPTETIKSPVRVATTAEARTGTANDLLVTPLRLQEVTATETRKGVIEIATQAEVDNGTDTDRAVVPSKLKAYTDDRLSTTGNLGTAATKAFGNSTGNLPEVTYQEVTISGGGFSSFTLKCMKVGRLVSLWTDSAILHSSGSAIQSSDGQVPSAFRPAGTYYQGQVFGATTHWQRISAAGALQMEYRDASGSPVSRTSSTWPFNVTYGTSA